MVNALFNQTNYVATKRMLDATMLRHEAIASNLAHVETPNYKRIDLAPSFQTQLKQAISTENTAQIARTTPRLEVDPTAVASTRDGNTVQLETELGHLQQNLVEHALETQLVTGNLLRLRLAITGRPA